MILFIKLFFKYKKMPEKFWNYDYENKKIEFKKTEKIWNIDFVKLTKEREAKLALEKQNEAIWISLEAKGKIKDVSIEVEYENTTPEAKKFLEKYPNLYSPDFMDAIEESLKLWLKIEEVKFVLEWKYQNLKKFPKARQEKILDVISDLKNKKMLDFVDTTRLEDFLATSAFDDKDEIEKLEVPALKRVLRIAIWELWITEAGWATKYFREQGMRNKATNTHWCAAYVNWVLMKAWLPWTGSNLAKSFIKWDWAWHAWFKCWPGRMISWNRTNKVSYSSLPRRIEWYAIPTEKGLVIKRWNFPDNQIPEWAIVVMWRNTKTRQGRRAS